MSDSALGTGQDREVFRIMTVCTGNICRSPMAESVLRTKCARAGLDTVEVDSTGVSDEEQGNGVDHRAVRVLRERGYDVLTRHRARRLAAADLSRTNLVLPMTVQHARVVRRLVSQTGTSPMVRMLRSFDPETAMVAGGVDRAQWDIADPWYGGEVDFEEVMDQIEVAADGVVAYVRAHAGR